MSLHIIETCSKLIIVLYNSIQIIQYTTPPYCAHTLDIFCGGKKINPTSLSTFIQPCCVVIHVLWWL